MLSRLLKDTKWQRHNQIFILTVSHLQIFTVKSLDEYHIDIDDNDEVEANEQSEDAPEVSQEVRASESKLLLLHLDLLTAEHDPGDRHVSFSQQRLLGQLQWMEDLSVQYFILPLTLTI